MNRLSSFLTKINFTIKTSSTVISSSISRLPFPSSSLESETHMASMNSTTNIGSNTNSSAINRRQKLKKVVVIMGPTGSGKSKLSVDLATRFFPNSEIINSDKIQVYRGLDIATNKISMHDQKGVLHHFLGEFDPETEFSPSDFRRLAQITVSDIISHRNIPFLVGGSNSFIYSLLAKRFNPDEDVFDESVPINSISSDFRYSCCFLWVDVSLPILNKYLDKRVDEMLDSGMYEELEDYFSVEGFAESESASRTGLRKAIGVPEFERYFKRVGLAEQRWTGTDNSMVVSGDVERAMLYEEAVKAIKDNTWTLAKRQLEKIQRLRDTGWDLQRIDATEAFRAAMGMGMTSDSGKRASDIWEKMVVEPSVKIVKRFLME